ncbi:MAG: S46 family peptidase [Ahniella sp.]|nr:S46 family peptidase [Ahniella sp.]
MQSARLLLLICLSWLALWPACARALEGLWPPYATEALTAQAKQVGLQIDVPALADPDGAPLGAVVSFGSCTGVLVSPDGLILTNQHCLLGSLQLASSQERQILRDGFLAGTRADELAFDPNLRVYLLADRLDATRGILRGGQRARGRRRFETVNRISKRMIDHCERDPDLRCELSVLNGGREFELLRQRELRDVRLVYVPPMEVANFGGEFDNWMWPRHAADVALVRVWVAPDGSSRTFDADNVPYRSRHWLRTSTAGVELGEPVWLAGFPSRTNRNRTAAELQNVIEWQYPRSIKAMNEVMAVIEAAGEADPKVAMKYAAMLQSIANYEKNFRGQLEGFSARDSLKVKQADEARFKAWLHGTRERERRYAKDVAALDAHLERWRAQRERDFVHGTVLVSGGAVAQGLGLARDLYRLNLARSRPEHRRDAGFQPRDEYRFVARVQSFDRRFDPSVDRQLFEVWLARYLLLPEDQRIPEFEEWLGAKTFRPDTQVADYRDRVDDLFNGTRVAELDTRERWLAAFPGTLDQDPDPMMQLAVKLFPALQRMELEFKRWNGDDARFRSGYLDAYEAFRKSDQRPFYPDANGGLRVTLGTVQAPGGIQGSHLTTMSSLMAKVSGEPPFVFPDPLLRMARQRQFGRYALPGSEPDLPINFLSDLDIAGGNSGSPTLNADGELVGLAFDTTWETVPSNWVFDAERARTIHVDARYWLWLLDEVSNAQSLLKEMGVMRTDPEKDDAR